MLEQEYYKLHKKNLNPLDIKIDCDLFESEISKYEFQPWGDINREFARYAVPLVNLDGILKDDDPACYPLDRWNFVNEFPHFKYQVWYEEHVECWKDWFNEALKTDVRVNELCFTENTEILNISSLNPLEKIKPYMIRSCILKWDFNGHFFKHFDTWHPTKWLRLWGTTKPDGMTLRYEENGKMIEELNIEKGRLYLHDSIKMHEALAYKDEVYHFFIAVNMEAVPIIKKLLK